MKKQKDEHISHEKAIQLISAGKRITTQSQMEGFHSRHVLDERPDTYWMASPYYQWIKLDLEDSYHITSFVLDLGTHNDRYYHYYIEYSCDNLNWTLVHEKTDDTICSEPINYDLGQNARYLRITMTYCSVGMCVQIHNLKVYGYAGDDTLHSQQNKVAGRKIAAIDYDEAKGFLQKQVDNIEAGQKDEIMYSDNTGSYLLFRQIDFTNAAVDQFRGNFGFPVSDREKLLTVELRLDHLEGALVGTLPMFRQYTPWTNLACDLRYEDGSTVTGVHDVYFILSADAKPQELMVHWLSFVQKSPLPVPGQKNAALPTPENDNYEIYFGNLHCHTAFSDGKAVPEYAYDYARNVAGLDFLSITEHSNLYDEAFDFDKSRKWADIRKYAEEKTEEGHFLALYGSETTWYNQFGHMNTYHVDFYLNSYELKYNDIRQYYDAVKQYPNSINQWNHPWSCGKRHLDYFEPYDEELDKVLYMVEINHLESPELGGLSYYVMALDKGWHVSPVGSQDNHNELWGTQNHLRTGALMERLTTAHFYDAIQNHRVYYTCATHLKVWFWVNDCIMGSRINKSDEYVIHCKARNQADDSAIVRAEVIGEQGKVLHTFNCDNHEIDFTVTLTGTDKYYFIKVYQANEEFAATSPVWIEAE